MTAKTIVLNWLQSKAGETFYSFDFERDVPIYGNLKYDKTYTASTYSRAFRDIRSSDGLLEALNMTLEEVKHNNNKSKGWRIQKINASLK